MSVEPSEDIADAFESTIPSYDQIAVGESVTLTNTITEDDVSSFAIASADTNPLHLDADYAENTRFNQPIAHGMLVSGTVSAALARLPGVVVYLSQEMEYCAPVFVGDTVTAVCEIVEALGENKYRLSTVVKNADGTIVIDGEAVVLIDEEPAA